MMRARFDVDVYLFEGSATDDRGRREPSWADIPLRQKVFGWAPPSSDQLTALDGAEVIDRDLDLYVPQGFQCGPLAKVVVDSVAFQALGHVKDYSHGPFGFNPGGVVALKRSEVVS